MQFDTLTLFNLLLMQALLGALLLFGLPGWRTSRAMRWARGSMALLVPGWLLLAQSANGNERVLMSLALLAFTASLSALWWAISLWLVPRSGRWLMAMATLLMPLVYGLQYDDAAFRVGWAHAWLALQLLMIALAAVLPTTKRERTTLVAPVPAPRGADTNGRRWRTLIVLATLPLALVCLLRGAMGLFTDAPADPFSPQAINILFSLVCQLSMTLLLLALVLAWRSEIEADLARLAQADGLTGLADRLSFVERAVGMISMARRHNEPLVLMVMDVDFLKAVNTEQGAEAGDRALALFGSCVHAQMRLGDLAGRIGGEEFAVLMARTDALGPQAFDKRMRDALAHRAVQELGFELNFSAGWAKLRHGDRSIDDLMRRAETALYEAKHAGRGQLIAEPGID